VVSICGNLYNSSIFYVQLVNRGKHNEAHVYLISGPDFVVDCHPPVQLQYVTARKAKRSTTTKAGPQAAFNIATTVLGWLIMVPDTYLTSTKVNKRACWSNELAKTTPLLSSAYDSPLLIDEAQQHCCLRLCGRSYEAGLQDHPKRILYNQQA